MSLDDLGSEACSVLAAKYPMYHFKYVIDDAHPDGVTVFVRHRWVSIPLGLISGRTGIDRLDLDMFRYVPMLESFDDLCDEYRL